MVSKKRARKRTTHKTNRRARNKKKASLLKRSLFFLFNVLFRLLRVFFRGSKVFVVFLWKQLFQKTRSLQRVRKKQGVQRKNNAIYEKPVINVFSDEEGFEEFARDLHEDSLLLVILGRRGSGKTALAHSIAQEMATHQGKRIVTLNEPKPIRGIENYSSLDEVPQESIVIADEAGIHFSGRSASSSKNKDFLNALRISRHRGISVIIVSQDSGSVDVGLLRLADYLIMKRITQSMFDFERPVIQKRLRKGYEALKDKKEDKSLFYVLSDDFTGLCRHRLATYWTQKTSVAYRKDE